MKPIPTGFCLSLVLLLPTVSVAQRVSPFQGIPQSAAAVARISGVDRLSEDVGRFVDVVQPGFGNIVRIQLPILMGNVLTNPTLNGIDKSRDWYVAGFAGENQDAVLVLPVTDAEAAKETLQENTQSIEHGDWLICCRKDAVLNQIKACVGGGDSFESVMSEESRQQFDSGHVGLYVHGKSLKSSFANELASAEDQLDRAIDRMISTIEGQNAQVNLDYVKEFYGLAGRMLIQAIRDSDSVVVSARLEPTGLQIDKTVSVAADTETTRFFASQPTNSLEEITKLPEDNDVYFAFHGDPKPLIEQSGKMMGSLIPDAEVRKKAEQAIAAMKEATFGTFAGAFKVTDESEGALRYAGSMQIDKPALIRESFSYYGKETTYDVGGLKQTMSFEAGAEKIGDTPVDVFRIQQELPAELDPTGMQKKMVELIYGPEGMTQRIVTTDDGILQTMGGGLETMKSLMNHDASWTSSTLTDARSRQLQNANMVSLVDLPNMARNMFTMILSSGGVPIPINADDLNAVPVPRSYAGSSVAMDGTQLKARLHIPAETVRGFVALGMYVQSQFAPR